MRTVSGGNDAQPTSTLADFTDAVKIEVADDSDVLQDLTEFAVSLEYDPGTDEIVDSATIVFRRLLGASSLAPLMTASPPLGLGRRIVVSINPGSGTYTEVFRGKIDTVDWPDRDGDVTVECRDQAGVAADTWIEEEIEYGDTTGVALEDVMQSVVNDNLAVAPTLYFPAATSAVVQNVAGDPAYAPSDQSALDALRALAESIGWTIRWRHFGASASDWKWTVFEPSRAKTVADHTFGTSDYWDVTTIRQAIEDIRNVIVVEYIGESGTVERVQYPAEADVATDPSVLKYGRRFMKIAEGSGSPVNNATLALAMATAAYGDLSEPDALLEITGRYFWPGEIGVDLYTFTANNIHFSSDQTLAAMGFKHRIAVGERPTTKILTRGKPSGGVLMWRRKAGTVTPTVPQTADILAIAHRELVPYGSAREFTITIGARVDTVHLHYRVVPVDVAGDPWDFSGSETVTEEATLDILRRVEGSTKISFSLDHPAKGYRLCARMVPVSSAGEEGDSWPFYLDPAEEVALTVVAKLQATTTETVTVRVQVADPYPQGSNSATIAYAALGATVTEASGQTVTPVDTITGAAGTYFDFIVTRPAPGANGRVSFTATAAGRSPGVDAVDIPALDGIPQGSISINEDGSVAISVDGSSWVASYKYATSTSAFPSDATAIAGTTLNGRQATVSLGAATLDLGDTIYATFVPYSQTGAGGTAGSSFRMRATRHDASNTTTTYSTFSAVTEAQPGTFGEAQWEITSGGYLANRDWPATYGSGVWGARVASILTIPPGVTITGLSADIYTTVDSTGTIVVRLERISGTGGQTTIASVNDTTNGWETRTASCSESTTSRNYRILVIMSGSDPAVGEHRPTDGEIRASIFSYTYTRPSTVNAI